MVTLPRMRHLAHSCSVANFRPRSCFLSQPHRLLEMGFDRPAVEAALQKSRDPEDVLQPCSAVPQHRPAPRRPRHFSRPRYLRRPRSLRRRRRSGSMLRRLRAYGAAGGAEGTARGLDALGTAVACRYRALRCRARGLQIGFCRPYGRWTVAADAALEPRAAADAAAADTAVAGRVETWRLCLCVPVVQPPAARRGGGQRRWRYVSMPVVQPALHRRRAAAAATLAASSFTPSRSRAPAAAAAAAVGLTPAARGVRTERPKW